jgi:hypothetical protein
MGKSEKNKSYFEKIVITYFFNALYYKTTKNPLFLWEVFRLCREEDLLIPEWVNNYFDDCASKLLTAKDPGERAPFLCYEALDFKSFGPGTPWKKVDDNTRKLTAYYLQRIEKKTNPEHSQTEILESVIAKIMEKFGDNHEIEPRTLNRWQIDIQEKLDDNKVVQSIFNEIRGLINKS